MITGNDESDDSVSDGGRESEREGGSNAGDAGAGTYIAILLSAHTEQKSSFVPPIHCPIAGAIMSPMIPR